MTQLVRWAGRCTGSHPCGAGRSSPRVRTLLLDEPQVRLGYVRHVAASWGLGFQGHGTDADERDGRLGMRRRSANGAEDKDDRVGGRLAGTSMGGGVVTPFMAGVGAAGAYPHQQHYGEQPYARSKRNMQVDDRDLMATDGHPIYGRAPHLGGGTEQRQRKWPKVLFNYRLYVVGG
ncbi:hypothetical protein C8J57DRAFT_1535311 [Mycena rebaudengoi]|nr:hypothetical protein C8J57DRAFT_1535311 [Mycena rebaudengoi]